VVQRRLLLQAVQYGGQATVQSSPQPEPSQCHDPVSPELIELIDAERREESYLALNGQNRQEEQRIIW